jgi:hypothetical protein
MAFCPLPPAKLNKTPIRVKPLAFGVYVAADQLENIYRRNNSARKDDLMAYSL